MILLSSNNFLAIYINIKFKKIEYSELIIDFNEDQNAIASFRSLKQDEAISLIQVLRQKNIEFQLIFKEVDQENLEQIIEKASVNEERIEITKDKGTLEDLFMQEKSRAQIELEELSNRGIVQLKIYINSQYLHILQQDYINNERKLLQVIKQLIGLKKNPRKVLFKQNGDELVEFQEITKLCCVKEIQYVFGEQKVIDKFDLTLFDDLVYLTVTIGNLLLQNKIQSIKHINENVIFNKISDHQRSQLIQNIQILGMADEEQNYLCKLFNEKIQYA